MTIAALILALIATPPADVVDAAPGVSASRGEPVLLDFHAQWCGPCKAMRPGLAQLAAAGYPIRSIDAEQERELAARYDVTSYPTFIVVDDAGKVLARTEGYQPAADLATLYREAQAKVRSRPKLRPAPTRVSGRPDDDARPDDADTPGAEEPQAQARGVANPQPWETVVRIRIRLGGGSEGVGSGTIIHSDARQAIIMTCAHIFKEDGRTPPPPSQFRLPIAVDLFDGQPGGPKRNQVHYLETVKGEAIDYDPLNDVGLIRIRPGRVLPATRVVPPQWKPAEGMHMYTVGCSEGRDATAWDTRIVRPKAGLMVRGTDKTFSMIECDTAPKQGRSGGGLYTDDFYLAGVCDFADPQHNRGLYAVPQSLYKILDRNKLTVLYEGRPKGIDDGGRMLAKAGDASKPRASEPGGTFRGQSPAEGDITIPPPGMLGIKPPVVAANEDRPLAIDDAPRATKPWHAPAGRPEARTPGRREAVPAGLAREGESENAGDDPTPSTSADPADTFEAPAPSIHGGKSKWRPVRKSADGL